MRSACSNTILFDRSWLLAISIKFYQSLPFSLRESVRLKSRRPVQFVVMLICVSLIASCGGKSDDDVPLIFAAASLSDVLTESAEIYESETGNQVDFSFSGSIALANQITKLGAPADGAFVVGSEAIGRIADAGLVGAEGYGSILSNRLVLVGRSGVGEVGGLADLLRFEGRIAIGDPELAPAGVYAKQALESTWVWDEVGDRLIMTSDVRAALGAVRSGNVEFAIVYASDVASIDDGSIRKLLVIEDGYDSISYAFVPIKGAKNEIAAAELFTFFVNSQEVQNIFRSAGFEWNVHAGEASVPGSSAK
jgi:molybdate transport system substrate-binding protein